MAFIQRKTDPKNGKNGKNGGSDKPTHKINDDFIDFFGDEMDSKQNNTCMKPMIKNIVNLPTNIDTIPSVIAGLISSFLPANDRVNFKISSSTVNANINACYLPKCRWMAKISDGNIVIKYVQSTDDMKNYGRKNPQTMTISKHFKDNESYTSISDYIKTNVDGVDVWYLLNRLNAQKCIRKYHVSCVEPNPIKNEMVMLDPENNDKLNTKEFELIISMLRHPLVKQRFISSVNNERECLRIRSIKFDCSGLSRNIGVRPAVHQNIIYYGNKTQTRIGIKISEICYVCFKSIKGSNWKAENKYKRVINLPNKIVNKIEGFYILISGQIQDLLLSPEKIWVHYDTKKIALIDQKDTILMMTTGIRKDFIFLQRNTK